MDITTIEVRTRRPYQVRIGQGLLNRCGQEIGSVHSPCKVCLAADDVVDRLYGDQAAASLTAAGFVVTRFVFPHGEAAKSHTVLLELYDALMHSRISRGDLIVALGGGVCGDLAGFAAATFMRGIDFVQLPTTLLAAVDSSVGGKTGVNLPGGKNTVGAFWQPILCLCDTGTFDTLPADVFAGGMAEVVKYAALFDKSLLDIIKGGLRENPTALCQTVARCVALKVRVVTDDERDHGRRQLLNFGHTVGHAIETLSNYQIPHGHAVAIGMVIMARAAFAMGLSEEDCAPVLTLCLCEQGLPVACTYTARELAEVAAGDKKRDGDGITVVLPRTLGEGVLHRLPVEELEALLAAGLS